MKTCLVAILDVSLTVYGTRYRELEDCTDLHSTWRLWFQLCKDILFNQQYASTGSPYVLFISRDATAVSIKCTKDCGECQ